MKVIVVRIHLGLQRNVAKVAVSAKDKQLLDKLSGKESASIVIHKRKKAKGPNPLSCKKKGTPKKPTASIPQPQ